MPFPSPVAPRIGRAAAGAALALALGCGSPVSRGDGAGPGPAPDVRAAEPPATSPSIRGTVTRVQAGDSVARGGAPPEPGAPVSCPPTCGGAGTPMRALLVEETPGAASGDKSLVRVPSTARVLLRTADGVVAAGFADLRVGQRVEAWFAGPVLESYPTQATAGTLLIAGP